MLKSFLKSTYYMLKSKIYSHFVDFYSLYSHFIVFCFMFIVFYSLILIAEFKVAFSITQQMFVYRLRNIVMGRPVTSVVSEQIPQLASCVRARGVRGKNKGGCLELNIIPDPP